MLAAQGINRAGKGTLQYYRISGFAVASEFELPGQIAGEPQCAAQVTIRRGPAPHFLPEPSVSAPTWQLSGKQLLLHVPNVARFLLTDGREIMVGPEPAAGESDVSIFILNTAFGILLHQRDEVVLHASAVRVNGRAVLFCGASGGGKSTLAAALVQRGYPMVADDICRLAANGSGPVVYPDGCQLKLWAQAIDRLGLAHRRGAPVRESLEKFYVEPGAVSAGPLSLAAIYVLREARPPHASGIQRPNYVDRAMLLRVNAYRPSLVHYMDQSAQYLHAATTVADTAGLFYFTRPFDFARIAETLTELERHWLALGLREQPA
jgi:hypothetical protein